ncbi:MAG: thioesterase family protein [Chloroflexi bacterium]|nr:thioesterase family protein [Chloroflexota bacterium]
MEPLSLGLTARRSLTVAEEHTAVRWGSGAVQVLSTPQMIALMEGAAVDAVEPLLPAGQQTVGSRLEIEHLAPSAVGAHVTAQAELIAIEGRRLTFRVSAEDGAGLIGRGTHERFVVDVARFMAGAAQRPR